MNIYIKINIVVMIFMLSTNLFSQEKTITKFVFMLDPNFDVKKLKGQDDRATIIRVLPSTKSPSGLETPEYTFNKGQNDINFSPSFSGFLDKTQLLEINPNKLPRFFIEEKGDSFIKTTHEEIFYDFNIPGEFSNKKGDIILPASETNNLFIVSSIAQKDLFQKAGNKAKQTNDEIPIFDNLTKNGQTFVTNFERNNIKLSIRTGANFSSVNINTRKYIGISYEIRLKRQLILLVSEKTSLIYNMREAKALTKRLGDTILELTRKCSSVNKPFYCNAISTNDPGLKEYADKLKALIIAIPGFENTEIFSGSGFPGFNLLRN